MSRLNIVPKGHNKSVYFVMPLLTLNRYSFGTLENFYNAYVSFNGKLIVLVKDKDNAGPYIEHKEYLTDFDLQIEEDIRGTAIIYSIPKEFENDIIKFLEGQYSKYSQNAKELIFKHSGLPYRAKVLGSEHTNTHKLLLVLEKHDVLKKWLEDQLDIKLFADDEFLEKPEQDRELIDIDTITV